MFLMSFSFKREYSLKLNAVYLEHHFQKDALMFLEAYKENPNIYP